MGFDEEDNVETTEKLKQIEEELGVAGNFVGNKVKVGESGDKNEERTDGSGDKNGQQKEDTAGASGTFCPRALKRLNKFVL